ncbi:FtsK/SpoIIIE family DNA translocase [Flavihumibacter profundi]|uniref:FtsK/SpoIIIE family DNA translocase n=1 Tax=Flavihumibacter profundi TaxID=2716883 RepID=UPI001CC442CA|nr:DNA translocase FtsK [Flavihumibacter profundi]MBZ5857167.1 DNA translocase FtsK [Flavihumibacter profundi]
MANKLKTKKKPIPEPVDLRPEKEEKVAMQSLVKDERTLKITGAVLLLLAIFLFIAFTSYLFTWQEDQDKVFKGGSHFLFADDIKVSNLLGRLGAWVSHFFFYKGFGLASYFICSLFFVAGANLLFGKKLFRLTRNIRYVIVGLLYFSITLAFFFGKSTFSWGGAVGKMISDWMASFLGTIGTAAILLAGGVAYFIWRFNPTINVPQMPNLPSLPVRNKTAEDLAVADPRQTATDEPKLFIEEPVEKKNSLKKEGGVVVMPPVAEPELALEIIEKNQPLTEDDLEEEETEVPEIPHAYVEMPPVVAPVSKPVPQPVLNANPAADLELEIKTVPETPEEPGEEGLVKAEELAPYEPTLDLRDYKYPSMDLLETHGSEKIVQDPAELEAHKNQIINTLKNYDIQIQKISATVGPTVTLYEIVPAAGVRISRIKNLEDDIALSLAALGIRIIAPIPGKGTIGIEVPNVKKTVVSMKTLLTSEKFQHSNFSLPIAIGKKIDNENFIVDLAAMPHLLMAGATGQGKSVGLNAILVSLLYKKHPSQLKFVLVDPKKVELSLYRTIEKHFLAKLPGEEEAIITDTKKVINTLNALCIEMDNRYDLLKEAHTRNIKEYNEKFIKRKLNPNKGHQYLPFIVLVIDEFADLIMTAGKEVEMPIARLAQLARAVGIHLIIATQRPSVNIITGTIKANFPARIAFKVSSKIDSRTILDAGGAEQLIGKGDMLISYNGELTRLQCAFVDTPEVEEVTEFIGNQRGYPQAFLLPEYVDEKDMEGKDFDLNDKDPLFEDAARLIVQNQVGSTSLLQRRMKLGYNRAGRLMDQLEAAGVVGPNLGSKARDVLIKTEVELESYLTGMP